MNDDPLQLALAMITACQHQDEAFVAELINTLDFRDLAHVLAATVGVALGLATEIVENDPEIPDMDAFLQTFGLNIINAEP